MSTTLAEELEIDKLSTENFKLVTHCDGPILAEEGLKEIWNTTKTRVLEMFGHQETLSKQLQSMLSAEVFDNLKQDKIIKACLPKDRALAMVALQSTNEILAKLRSGDLINLSEFVGKDFEDVGIECREDGVVHTNKFQMGDWGAGKGKSNVSSPLEFKKTVEEVKWDVNGKALAEELLKQINVINKSKMIVSINLHYQTLIKAVYSKQEKDGMKVDKEISIRQIKNMIAVRNMLIKFLYKQIKKVTKAYIPPTKEEELPANQSE